MDLSWRVVCMLFLIQKGNISGMGKIYTPENYYIEGYFINSEPYGDVRFVFDNGDFYVGETKNYKADGQGIFHQNGVTYGGTFK